MSILKKKVDNSDPKKMVGSQPLKKTKKVLKSKESDKSVNPLLSEPPKNMLSIFGLMKELNKDRVYTPEQIGSTVIFDSNSFDDIEKQNNTYKKQELLLKKLRNGR